MQEPWNGRIDKSRAAHYGCGMAQSALAETATNMRSFTYADYKAWELKPGERFELVYGEALAMAAPSAYHQSILMELAGQIRDYLKGKPCKIYPAPYDVRLFYEAGESDDTVVQPDVTVVCDPKKRGQEGCRGAPDLVAEILSDSNTAFEMTRKFELYRVSGVREYWVLDPEKKTLHTYLFNGDTIRARSCTASDHAPVSIFPGLEIDLHSVFEEEPEPAGPLTQEPAPPGVPAKTARRRPPVLTAAKSGLD